MSLFRSRIALILLACLAAAGVVGARALFGGGSHADSSRARPPSAISSTSAVDGEGSVARFRFLANQTSNQCGLRPDSIAGMPKGSRLRGSCCSPMDLAAYQSQIRGLRRYAGITQIPRDPYDVPVSLVKRLLAYDRTIRLTRTQQRAYGQGMRMSREKGPCCCRCWRWDAFRGLSKYLIAQRGWRPARLGHLIELLDGCGGRGEHA